MISALEPVLNWMLSEIVVTAFIASIYAFLSVTIKSAADRYLFLSIAFATVLLLPFVPIHTFIGLFHSGAPVVNAAGGGATTENLWRFASAARLPFLRPLFIGIVCIYAIVSVVMLTQVCVAAYKLRTLAKDGKLIAMRGEVPVLATKRACSPLTFGWIRPVILLPSVLLEQVSPAELEMILVHEEQHIVRRDYLRNLLRLMVQAALCFSPFIHWLSKRFVEEMELSCDALTIERTQCASRAYGSMLVRLSTNSRPGANLMFLGLFMSQSFLSRRIISMKFLKSRRNRCVPIGAFACLTLLMGPGLRALGIEASVYKLAASDKVNDNTQRSLWFITADSMRRPSPNVILYSGHVKLNFGANGVPYRITSDSISSEGDDFVYKGHVEIGIDKPGTCVIKTEFARQTKDLNVFMDAAEVYCTNDHPDQAEK